MNLEPSAEQVLLRDMVRRFLADHRPPAGPGHASTPDEEWGALGELGVLSLLAPEAAGGLGGGPQEIAILAEEMGRALAMTPLAESIVLCAGLIADGGSGDQRAAWIEPLLSGERLVAYAGSGEGYGALAIAPSGDGWVLNGERRQVRRGGDAAALIVEPDAAGAGLLLVEPSASGLSVLPYRTADGEMAALVRFEGVQVRPSDRLAVTAEQHGRALALAKLAVVAEMVGLMDTLYAATVDYVKQRRQFGVPIASFQVIQHRVARLFILLEQSRSMLLRAVGSDDARRGRTVAEAFAYVADAALRLAQDATQLHGGMGVTDELDVGRGHRRLLVLSHLFGGAITARAALAA